MDQVTFLEPGRVEVWDVEPATLQGDGQALVRPLAVASCDLDAVIAAGRFPAPGPFPLGHEGVGQVLEVGSDVRTIRPGQRVSIPFQISCGRCDRCQRGLTATCTGNGAARTGLGGGQFYGLGEGGRAWGGFLSDVVRVPFAEHMLVPVPDDIAPASIASLSDNVADAYARVAPGLARVPGAPVLVVCGSSTVGLYAVGVALALGAERVDYAAVNTVGVERAEKLGATIIDPADVHHRGPYPVTVDASATPAGLLSALRSTDSGGICSSIGFYAQDVTLTPGDLLNLYFTDVTFAIGLVHARAAIPPLLDLVRAGRLRPETVTADVLAWDQAPMAMATVRDKLVFVREEASDEPHPPERGRDRTGAGLGAAEVARRTNSRENRARADDDDRPAGRHSGVLDQAAGRTGRGVRSAPRSARASVLHRTGAGGRTRAGVLRRDPPR